MDEGKLRAQQSRADRAKRLLDDELIQEAFDKIEREIDQSWKNSPADAERERYNAYLMYRLLQNFKGHFTALVATGEHARKQLLQIEQENMLKRMIHGR
jgi:hypothetical protein